MVATSLLSFPSLRRIGRANSAQPASQPARYDGLQTHTRTLTWMTVTTSSYVPLNTTARKSIINKMGVNYFILIRDVFCPQHQTLVLRAKYISNPAFGPFRFIICDLLASGINLEDHVALEETTSKILQIRHQSEQSQHSDRSAQQPHHRHPRLLNIKCHRIQQSRRTASSVEALPWHRGPTRTVGSQRAPKIKAKRTDRRRLHRFNGNTYRIAARLNLQDPSSFFVRVFFPVVNDLKPYPSFPTRPVYRTKKQRGCEHQSSG